MMRRRPAPTDRAASMTPGCTVRRFCSTIRLIPKAAASESVKMMALFPIPLPVTERASGWAAARKMMNGIGRKMFTSTFSTPKTARLARSAPDRVVYSPSPMRRPPIPPKSRLSPTM